MTFDEEKPYLDDIGMTQYPDIDTRHVRYPFCIVWTPIPVLTWMFPFIGHMGICTSTGVVRDFAGPYYVSEDNMAFGKPTKYWQLKPDKIPGGSTSWDRAVADAAEVYKTRMHNLCCDNCHSMVALALNKMKYDNSENWNMVNVAFLSLVHSRYIGQLVSAVFYLHRQDISHRDLKCENIFLTAQDKIVLGDFGFARKCLDKHQKRVLSETFCGSAAYAAPEILQGIPYNPKMYDVWSLGCVLFIMLTSSMPFDDSNIHQMIQHQLMHQLDTHRFNLRPSADKLLHHMLHPDITRRGTISQISHSPWLREHFHHNSYSSNPTNYGTDH